MRATIYTGQSGTIHPHITITALTEAEVDLMESIESALCRYVRVTKLHPTEGERITDAFTEALILLDEYGPSAVIHAATPAGADDLQAKVWRIIRGIAVQRSRVGGRPIRPAVVRSDAEALQLARHHNDRALDAFRAGEHNLALTWLDAAQGVDPRLDPWSDCVEDAPDYDRLRGLVAEGAALIAA